MNNIVIRADDTPEGRKLQEMFDKWSVYVYDFFDMCDNDFRLRHLPQPGGYYDQDFWIMDVFRVIGNVARRWANNKMRG